MDVGIHKKITKAVVTCPAYFNSAQKQATRDACRVAGLDCKRIINEPTAAAIAYNCNEEMMQSEDGKIILIFDLGGGTLDVSLVNIEGGSVGVIASDGDTYLGGRDFDEALVNHCMDEFKRAHNIDLRKKNY